MKLLGSRTDNVGMVTGRERVAERTARREAAAARARENMLRRANGNRKSPQERLSGMQQQMANKNAQDALTFVESLNMVDKGLAAFAEETGKNRVSVMRSISMFITPRIREEFTVPPVESINSSS